MTTKIKGRFFFKRTNNGNLLGEWSNNADSRIYSESSDRLEATADFPGVYHSTWQENGMGIYAKLKIDKRSGTSLFDLKWTDINGKNMFEGTGMLCDDILIGDYHSA